MNLLLDSTVKVSLLVLIALGARADGRSGGKAAGVA